MRTKVVPLAPPSVGGSGFTPQPGFNITPDTVFGDKLGMTITRSSGSFGTHSNYNKTGSLQWNGLTFLCFLAKNFEGQTAGTNLVGAALTNGIQRSQGNGGANAQWQIASVAPTNRTVSAARNRIDATTDPLELDLPGSVNQTYTSVKINPTAGTPAGKFLRCGTGGAKDWWIASGCNDFSIRGAADNMSFGDNTQFGSPNNFTTGAWNQFEMSADNSTRIGTTRLNGAVQWSVNPWEDSGWQPSGTHDLGCERDDLSLCSGATELPWYFTDWFVDFTLARFVMGDSSNFNTCNRHEFQVPVTWGTTSVRVGMNIGEFSSYVGNHGFFVDSTETVTYLGHW